MHFADAVFAFLEGTAQGDGSLVFACFFADTAQGDGSLVLRIVKIV